MSRVRIIDGADLTADLTLGCTIESKIEALWQIKIMTLNDYVDDCANFTPE